MPSLPMKNVFLLLFGCANKMAAKETMNEAIEEVLKKLDIPSLKREIKFIIFFVFNRNNFHSIFLRYIYLNTFLL